MISNHIFLQKINFKYEDSDKLKVKGWKNNTIQTIKKSYINLNVADFRTREIITDKRHYTIKKKSIVQEDIAIVNGYVTKNKVPEYVQKNMIERKVKMEKSTIILYSVPLC